MMEPSKKRQRNEHQTGVHVARTADVDAGSQTTDIAMVLDKETGVIKYNGRSTLAGATESTHAARRKDLGTTKLLERILLRLDTKDHLLSQRVGKTFKAIIHNSLPIQPALFSRPSKSMAPINNNLYFPQGCSWNFRGRSHVSMIDVTKVSDRVPRYSIRYEIDRESMKRIKLRLPHSMPMLLRQPATVMKLETECADCDETSTFS